MNFVDDYGPGAPLLEGHGEQHEPIFPPNLELFDLEWSGAVGATVGFFCGIALVSSPLTVVYFYLT